MFQPFIDRIPIDDLGSGAPAWSRTRPVACIPSSYQFCANVQDNSSGCNCREYRRYFILRNGTGKAADEISTMG
jgi:hypothetical protein